MMNQYIEKKNQKKLSIGLLIALVGFPQISETIYTPALPNVTEGLQTSASMVEMTLAIYFIGFAIGVLLWGMISDYFGRRSTMLVGLILYGIATWKCAHVESVEFLLAWRFLQAFGASVGSVITQTILRDAYDGSERAKLFSIMSGALAFSPALGPVLGGFISEFLGWRANFLVLALLAIALIIWSFFCLPETRPIDHQRLTNDHLRHLSKKMMKSKILWGHILLIGATNGILFGFYQEAPFVFIEQLGLQPSYYGFFGVLIASATILAAKMSYTQSTYKSPQLLIQKGAICVLLGGLLFSVTITGIFTATLLGITAVILTLFLIFFGIGLIIPNSLSQALKPYQISAGTAGSLFGGCYYIMIAGCTWLMSMVHNDTALPLSLYITSLGIVIICGCKLINTAETEELTNS